jgi:hypothetical protein
MGFDVLESESHSKGYLHGFIVRPTKEKRFPLVAMLNRGLCFENRGLKTLRQRSLNCPRGRDLYCFRSMELLSMEMEVWEPLVLMRSVDLLA